MGAKLPGDGKNRDKLFCVPKATFLPPEEGSGLFLGGHCGEGGPMALLPLPKATSTADSHPCQVPCAKGRVKGTSVLQCVRLATKQLWPGTSSTHCLGGKLPLTQILGNTQVLWAPPTGSTSPGAAGTSLHPCPLKLRSWSLFLALGEAEHRLKDQALGTRGCFSLGVLTSTGSLGAWKKFIFEVVVSIGLIASMKRFPCTFERFVSIKVEYGCLCF